MAWYYSYSYSYSYCCQWLECQLLKWTYETAFIVSDLIQNGLFWLAVAVAIQNLRLIRWTRTVLSNYQCYIFRYGNDLWNTSMSENCNVRIFFTLKPWSPWLIFFLLTSSLPCLVRKTWVWLISLDFSCPRAVLFQKTVSWVIVYAESIRIPVPREQNCFHNLLLAIKYFISCDWHTLAKMFCSLHSRMLTCIWKLILLTEASHNRLKVDAELVFTQPRKRGHWIYFVTDSLVGKNT